jgi:hypothetical protein
VRDLASVGVGALDLGWLGTIYRQRTMPTITMSRMGYIIICLDGKCSYILYPMD